jgi:hypothetical protein
VRGRATRAALGLTMAAATAGCVWAAQSDREGLALALGAAALLGTAVYWVAVLRPPAGEEP